MLPWDKPSQPCSTVLTPALQPSSWPVTPCTPGRVPGLRGQDGRLEPVGVISAPSWGAFGLQAPPHGLTLFLGALGLWWRAAAEGIVPEGPGP